MHRYHTNKIVEFHRGTSDLLDSEINHTARKYTITTAERSTCANMMQSKSFNKNVAIYLLLLFHLGVATVAILCSLYPSSAYVQNILDFPLFKKYIYN